MEFKWLSKPMALPLNLIRLSGKKLKNPLSFPRRQESSPVLIPAGWHSNMLIGNYFKVWIPTSVGLTDVTEHFRLYLGLVPGYK